MSFIRRLQQWDLSGVIPSLWLLHSIAQRWPVVISPTPGVLFPFEGVLPATAVRHVIAPATYALGVYGPFASRLNKLCKLSVQEADHHQEILPGVVYIGPAGLHMTVDRPATRPARICLSHEPLGTLHTPSVDVTMLSVAEKFRSAAMGIILTGMGTDGAIGMQAIFKAGGVTLGQDEATCTVYGMPRACVELGILQRVVSLQHVPEQILIATEHFKRRA